DAPTNESHRAEIENIPSIEYNKTYWVAFRTYVHDWGTLKAGDEALFGMQLHSGDLTQGFSPSFSLVTYGMQSGGRTFQVFASWSPSTSPSLSNAKSFKSNQIPIPFGRWADFVFKFRHNITDGLLQVWMDGSPIVDYKGPLGYFTPQVKDYTKFGFYNWTDTDRVKKVMLQFPVVVADPSGKYKLEDLRTFVNQ